MNLDELIDKHLRLTKNLDNGDFQFNMMGFLADLEKQAVKPTIE